MTYDRLGEFLRARRAQLTPDDVGLAPIVERRRVTGLRREELAQLAGVSVSYYTRLEQGQSVNASEAVLDSIATALRLDQHERQHLHALATTRPKRARRPPIERVDSLTQDLLRSLSDVPAMVLGRRTDVLAWNDLGHALLAGHIDRHAVDCRGDRPNLARMLFLDSHTRELYVDWHRKARAVVGNLRHVAGRYPDDASLAALIGELSMKSPEFVALWRDHRVKPCEADSYELRHPLVGSVIVSQQNLVLARSPQQSLCVMTTAAGLQLSRRDRTAGQIGARAAAQGTAGEPADRMVNSGLRLQIGLRAPRAMTRPVLTKQSRRSDGWRHVRLHSARPLPMRVQALSPTGLDSRGNRDGYETETSRTPENYCAARAVRPRKLEFATREGLPMRVQTPRRPFGIGPRLRSSS